MRQSTIVSLTLATAAIVMLGACGGNTAHELHGTSWTLAAVDGREALPETDAWLQFEEDGRAGGSTGCNSFGGTWKGDGGKLSFADLVSTLIACPGAVGDQEAAFNAALQATRSYHIEAAVLTLADETGAARMTFTAVESR